MGRESERDEEIAELRARVAALERQLAVMLGSEGENHPAGLAADIRILRGAKAEMFEALRQLSGQMSIIRSQLAASPESGPN